MLTPHRLYYASFNIKLLYINLTTLCVNGTSSCVDFMDVIMGDIPIAEKEVKLTVRLFTGELYHS